MVVVRREEVVEVGDLVGELAKDEGSEAELLGPGLGCVRVRDVEFADCRHPESRGDQEMG